MVRILAGTLLAVGMGRLEPKAVAAIIAGKDRRAAGQTAEPQGLTLLEIFYDEKTCTKQRKIDNLTKIS